MLHVAAASYVRHDGSVMVKTGPHQHVNAHYHLKLERIDDTERKPRRRHRKRERTRQPVPPLANRGEARLSAALRARAEPLSIPRLTLPGERLARINKMFERRQISGRQHSAAIRYMLNPDYLGPLHRFVDHILFRDLSAERLADPRVGRTRGIAEVMLQFKAGLDALVDHYGIGKKQKCDRTKRKAALRTLRGRQLMKCALDRGTAIKRAYLKSKFPIPYGPPLDPEKRAKLLSYLEARERTCEKR